MLIQHDDKGPLGNKSLTDTERRYCQTEKEALALVRAIEHFHMYMGRKLNSSQTIEVKFMFMF